MTTEEIAAERTRDYTVLGRFLGVIEFAKEKLISPDRAIARLIEIYDEYRKPVQPISSEEKL
jgi:hypothetical protein